MDGERGGKPPENCLNTHDWGGGDNTRAIGMDTQVLMQLTFTLGFCGLQFWTQAKKKGETDGANCLGYPVHEG